VVSNSCVSFGKVIKVNFTNFGLKTTLFLKILVKKMKCEKNLTALNDNVFIFVVLLVLLVGICLMKYY
jgi:hypothetical protein